MTRKPLIGNPVRFTVTTLGGDGEVLRVVAHDAYDQIAWVVEGERAAIRAHLVDNRDDERAVIALDCHQPPVAWHLLHVDGRVAQRGDRLVNFRGEPAVLVGSRPPHKPSSEGFVTTRDAFGHDEHHHPALDPDDDKLGDPRELYASVYGLTWSNSPDRVVRRDRGEV